MATLTTNSPLDAETAARWIAESKSATLKNYAFAAGALILTAGVAVAAVVWAHNTGTSPEALKAALASMPPLKVEGKLEASGKVALADGGIVKLEDGTLIGIDPDAVIGIRPDARVGVSGPQVVQQLPKLPVETNSAIATEVVVFKQVNYHDGAVVTGWNYPSGDAKMPSSQFCYFRKAGAAAGDGSVESIVLVGAETLSVNSVPHAEQVARSTQCQWFGGARTFT